MTSIYQQIIATGVKVDHQESDLYAPYTPQIQRLLAAYEHRKNCRLFLSNADNQLWYEIPFAYEPFWERLPK